MHEDTAVLEDISEQGACLQVDAPIPPDTDLNIIHEGTALFNCRSIYCVYREIGYYVGVEYSSGVVWSKRTFLPSHLLDLDDMIAGRN